MRLRLTRRHILAGLIDRGLSQHGYVLYGYGATRMRGRIKLAEGARGVAVVP